MGKRKKERQKERACNNMKYFLTSTLITRSENKGELYITLV